MGAVGLLGIVRREEGILSLYVIELMQIVESSSCVFDFYFEVRSEE